MIVPVLRAVAILLVAAAAGARPLADTPGAGPWSAIASDDVTVSPSTTDADVLSFRWDYRAHAGYAGATRALPIEWPDNFELTLPVGGDLAGNVLEIKFADASNDNVWWTRRVTLAIPAQGTTLRIRRRDIGFAWGPSTDHTLRRTARLEVIVTAKSGKPGALTVGPIELTPKDVPPAEPLPAFVTTGGSASPLPNGPASRVNLAADSVVDWGAPREIGGARIEWSTAAAHRYRIESSADGLHYSSLAEVNGAGRTDWVAFAATEDRYWRFVAAERLPGALLSLTPQAPDFGEEPNRRLLAIAKERPPGEYPRGFLTQTAWTVVGTPGSGNASGLLSEDGAYEWAPGSPSIEPVLHIDGTVATWATASSTQALSGGDLPLPSVSRRSGAVTLTVTAAAAPTADADRQWLSYALHNGDRKPHRVSLDLLLRPWQVNPPAQFLNITGGYSPIQAIRLTDAQRLTVATLTGDTFLALTTPADAVVAGRFDSSSPFGLPTGWAPPTVGSTVSAEDGFGIGALRRTVDLAPHGTATISLCIDGRAARPCTTATVAALRGSARSLWQSRLHRVTVDADAPLAHAVRDAVRTAHAHLLISADGPWLRPGTRSYARSWIRDGAMMSAGLLRLGETAAPLAYLKAWAAIQYSSGKVPCCHDARGADPVPENDSAGEFLYLAAQILQYGGAEGRQAVEAIWPSIVAAVGFMDRQRASTAADPAQAAYAGLLPVSISHEGYSAKPMHALWDDFWALRGYADAISIANTLHHADDAALWTAARADFSAAVRRALDRSMQAHGNDYLPGAADLGDFDPTSTTIALAPGTGGDDVPSAALERTFDRYWQFFLDRRDGKLAWEVYTPYEWRNVGAFIRLHQRERALNAFAWFFAARRPAAWNQWTEVVTQDPRSVRFIGDLPHGWVASDFLRTALDLYAFDDPGRCSLTLGSGLPRDWLEGNGVTVSHLMTPWGPLSYRARHHGRTLDVTLSEVPAAPGGLNFDFPGVRADADARVDGVRQSTDHGRLHLMRPAHHILFASE